MLAVVEMAVSRLWLALQAHYFYAPSFLPAPAHRPLKSNPAASAKLILYRSSQLRRTGSSLSCPSRVAYMAGTVATGLAGGGDGGRRGAGEAAGHGGRGRGEGGEDAGGCRR